MENYDEILQSGRDKDVHTQPAVAYLSDLSAKDFSKDVLVKGSSIHMLTPRLTKLEVVALLSAMRNRIEWNEASDSAP